MTTTVILSSSNDGSVACGHSDWNTAIDGANPNLVAGNTVLYYGADNDGATPYWAWQSFLQFTYARPANEVEVGVAIGVRHAVHYGATSRQLLMHARNFGASVDTGDWITPATMVTLTRCVRIYDAQASGTSQYVWAGSDELTKQLRDGGSTDYRFVVSSDRQIAYNINPSDDEMSGFWSAETSIDPTMVVSTVPRSTLYEVLGAQVQLSDGTWAVLESDGAASPTILLRHVDVAGTATTKATIPIAANSTSFTAGGLAFSTGSQQFALVVDSANNLFVIGRQADSTNNIAVKAYTKGVGYTWTAQALVAGTLPSSDTDPTNFAAAWHSTGSGTIVALISRCTSDGWRPWSSEMVYAVLSAPVALAGAGTVIRSTGYAVGVFCPTTSAYTNITQANDTGTGLDITALSSTKGVVHTWSRRDRLGTNQATTKARYILNSAGTGFDNVFYDTPDSSAGTWGVKTAAGKLRVIPVDSDTAVVVTADSVSDWGITAAAIRNSGTTTNFTLLGRVRFANESLTTMPSAATLAESQAWDAAYVTGPNKVWVYHLDTANGRRLMRTAMSLNSYVATREEIEVNASVGASGSTNHAIRVARGSVTTRRTLVTVANRSSGGTLSTIYVVDTPNEAPTAPTLATRSNFDASAATPFAWTFNDPDIGDTQSGFELDINSASGVDYYDTGRLGAGITYVGASAVAVGNNTSVAPVLPPSVSAGDLLVVQASIRNSGTGTVNTPTGWGKLAESGNFAILGRIAKSGAASAANSPTVSFTGGVANATTMARAYAWRGTDQNIATVVAASAAQLNGSAANIAYPQLIPGASGCAVTAFGWKQDDWTSVAQLAGMTEIADDFTTTGDDAGQVADYVIQSASATISAGSFTVTGGGSAISRALMLALRPYQAPTASSFTVPASTLTQPGSWQWRVRTWDAAGASGAWSSYSTFNTGTGGTVTVTDPVSDNPANVITESYLIAWSLTGATQTDFRVVVKRTDTEATVYTSGWVTSASTTHSIAGMVSDVEHRIEVTTRTALAVESQTGTRLITPSYSVPDEPSVSALEMPDDGHTLIQVTNPATTGDRPTVDYTQILRRAITGPEAGEDWVTVGAVDLNGEWRDYTAGAVTYEYVGRAIAVDGSTVDSEIIEATLTLQGIWIHDPADPANAGDSAHQFPHGWSGKSLQIDTMGSPMLYAGRQFPVFDFGEHESEQLDFPIQIPHGDTWLSDIAAAQGFARSRLTVCVRDTRGRRVFGVLTYSEADQSWGTGASFTVTRVDYDETTATL